MDKSPEVGDENAYYEHISIPDGSSLLWRTDDYPWRRNVWNYHPEIEIHLIRKSSGLCYIGDYIGNFEPGHLVMVGSDLPHNWITLPADGKLIRNRDVILQFHPGILLDARKRIPELSLLQSLFAQAKLGLEFMGKDAQVCASILEEIGQHSGLQRLGLMMELLGRMLQATNVRTLATQRFATGSRSGGEIGLRRLETALGYLQENFLESPRIEEVADNVGMSEAAFSRFFKKQTGNTFTDHVTILKVWTAKQLLRDSDMPVTEICFESGFRNVSNFNRMFFKVAGMKPSEYRKAARQFS
ncbi:AraC family transcriptional regulator [Pseudorhodobacter wandonensis]|uniref:AraC family transcriptional regulator n=1 Tax=Pseudorhodobacter wandonensis TaxID=1120568 RepID=UPI00067DC652|nr:AraC family transcriptional regulator [Pseudorhodobacter wandonensis]